MSNTLQSGCINICGYDTNMAEKRRVSGSPDSAGHSVDTMESNGVLAHDKEDMSKETRSNVWMLILCFAGIVVSYFIYGLVQEKITRRDFDGERFNYFIFLVFFQCVINAMVAKSVSWYQDREVSMEPLGLFAAVSFSYVGAMVASNSSLAFINYPTQVLGKSAKPIPILVFGVLISRKSYPLMKYLCVLLIVCGVAIFIYKDPPSQKLDEDHSQYKLFNNIGFGELLVLLSLTLDGITGVLQDRLKSHNTHALHMMYAMNIYASLYLLIGLVITGEGISAVGFVSRHPFIIPSLILFGLVSATGQIFVFTTITRFGPLTCSIITTTRKFITILASVIIFGNALLTRQWIGTVFVFVGLGLDAYFGKVVSNPTPIQQSA